MTTTGTKGAGESGVGGLFAFLHTVRTCLSLD